MMGKTIKICSFF